LANVKFVGPPEGFYSTAMTVSAALYIALAVEFRLLDPQRRHIVLPEDPAERKRLAWLIALTMVFPLGSVVGFVAAFGALYDGGTKVLGLLTSVGLSATLVPFLVISLRIFLGFFGGLIPWTDRQKGQIALGFAIVLIGVAAYLNVAYPYH
jgi:hypothetical protein